MAKMQVLVVEDEGVVARDIELMLNELGYEVPAVVATGMNAIEKARKYQPDAILMDIMLRGKMNGIEAAGRIHTELSIPIIYLSAHTDDETLERAKLTIPYAYLVKPFQTEELKTALKIALYLADVQKKLRRSEARYKAIIEDQTELICRFCDDGTLSFVNSTFCQFFEKSREQLLGSNFMALLRKEDRLAVARQIATTPLGDDSASLHDLEFYMPGGDVRWLQQSIRAIYDDIGHLCEFQCVGRDITERKHAEERLLLLSSAVEESLEGIAITDPAGHVKFCNPAYAAMHRLKASEVIGKHVSCFHTPAQMEQVEEMYDELLDKAFFEGEIMHARSDGSEFPGWMHVTMLRNTDDAPNAFIATLRDITLKKRSEAAMLYASRMETAATLAGGIAHQFNNLMAAVLGNAEFMLTGLDDAHPHVSMLDEVISAAEKAGDLAQQMLAFARGGKYQATTVSINQTITHTLELEDRSIPSTIEVGLYLEEALWPVKADSTQLSLVLLNMTANSVESINGKGEIHISTHNQVVDTDYSARFKGLHPGDYVHISFSDTGSGMSPTTARRVFEPFYSTKFQGRGLGLAAVFGILKNHGGNIYVDSIPGKGTTFNIYLPASKATPEVPAKNILKQLEGTETILLVDDEELILKTTKRIIEYFGYTVLVARNGLEALDIACSHEGDIHLCILDMAMPVLDGADTYPRLKALSPDMKVIILSGYELDATAQALLDAGADGFLEKPVSGKVLVGKIREALEPKNTGKSVNRAAHVI
jgi:PAS domain S-box-containing protein